MLRKLKLTKFRKHEDLEIVFGEGTTAIRGANERGKSSMLLGIAYALYGSGVLPLPLSEIVTWGCKESDLKVELDLEVGGAVHLFKRSGAGAEVLRDGVVCVTGQKAVSAYAAKLLGADANRAMDMMFAPQGNLRGTLENGPADAVQMLESLADLSVFDNLIEAMQAKLLLGSTSVFEQRLADADRALAELPVVEAPDAIGHELAISDLKHALEPVEAAAADAKRVESETWAMLQQAQRMLEARETLKSNRDRAVIRLESQTRALEHARTKVKAVDTELLIELKDKLVAAKQSSDLRLARLKVENAMCAYPELHWEGSRESLEAEIAKLLGHASTLRNTLAVMSSDLRVLKGQLATSDTCPTCKQKLPDSHAKDTVRVKVEIEALERDIATGRKSEHELAANISTLQAVQKSSLPFDSLSELPNVEVDRGFVPPKLKWGGPVVESIDDAGVIEGEIAILEGAMAASARAEGEVVQLTNAVIAAEAEARIAQEQLDGCTVPEDFSALRVAADNAARSSAELMSEVYALKARIDELTRLHAARQAEWVSWQSARSNLEQKIAECKGDLEKLSFNNALLKKVRAVRPLVANKLWDQVLASVSVMFSTMRGEKSVVTKTRDGFLCNGKRVEGLSGSTLDLLGLAIRCALVKTFIPHCPFIILDEPFAASDEARTMAMLGFIQGAGFNQVLLVTHEACTEAVCDNFLEL